MQTITKYAQLLVSYCLEVKEGQKVYIRSSTLAEPLIREVYREVLLAGGHPELALLFKEQNKIFLDNASNHQLDYISATRINRLQTMDHYLHIRAPYNLREESNIDPVKRKRRSLASTEMNQILSRRSASGEITRTLCQYPTDAAAQEAGMSLSEYEDFVYNACHLFADDPTAEWLKIRATQQVIVDHLNTCDQIQYRNERTDISFSIKGRTWINSDGRVNMPSGEVFTGPVEDTVQGTVHFDYPSIYMGREVVGVTLTVDRGEIVQWQAERGQEVLDQVMNMPGARYFGEVAIGTNYNIQQPTKNILFDEKIGGTIHMAVGQSYIATGGKNQSAIHWDLIAGMQESGEIYADGQLIYQKGAFLN